MKYPKKINGSTTIILIKMLLGKLHAKLKSLKEKKILLIDEYYYIINN